MRWPGVEERLAPVGPGDEAHVLAVGLVGGPQAQLGGPATHLGLVQVADRKSGAGQVGGGEHVQHIGLVLGRIGATTEAGAVGGGHDPGMVAGGDGIEAQRPRPSRQLVELDVPVALHARVGGATPAMRLDVGANHRPLEVVAQGEDQVFDAETVGHPSGVVDVAHRAAARVRRATPQLEGHPDHLGTGRHQLRGGDRAVDPARHRHQHPFGAAGPVSGAAHENSSRRSMAAGTAARAASTSASVLVVPRVSRSAPDAMARECPSASTT